MEALRTQNNKHRWAGCGESSAEREQPEASRSLDHEAQLERAKCNIDELTDRRMAEYTEAVERAEQRAVDAEDHVADLEQQFTDLRVSADPRRDREDKGADADRVRELQREHGERLVEVDTDVRQLTEELQYLQRCSAEEKEAMLQQTEVSGKIVKGDCATRWRNSAPQRGEARTLTRQQSPYVRSWRQQMMCVPRQTNWKSQRFEDKKECER